MSSSPSYFIITLQFIVSVNFLVETFYNYLFLNLTENVVNCNFSYNYLLHERY